MIVVIAKLIKPITKPIGPKNIVRINKLIIEQTTGMPIINLSGRKS